MGQPLSVFIITLNEADRLGRAIRSVQDIASEIVVVDSGSSDDTVAIAEGLGATVIYNQWPGYGPQKRFAETRCQHKWLLNIDADEVLSEELCQDISEFLTGDVSKNMAGQMAIVEVYPGEEKPARYSYSLKPVRLYHRDVGRYSDSLVHDRVELDAQVEVRRLKGIIHHYSIRSLGDQTIKLLKYADLQVADMRERGRHVSGLRLLGEFPWSFFKAYILRRHFLRGTYGYAIAVNYAYFRHMRLVKLMEVNSQRNPPESPL